MDNFSENNKKVKQALDKIGKGFCLAKWTQTTIHLGLGHTHSCHHPGTHIIPIEEIKKNPGALHNTSYKKSLRKEMLEGFRPSECNYCWKVEDLNEENRFSDRVFKSQEDWSWPYYDKIVNSSYDTDFNPKYLEISFSNVCNFRCSYCMPSISSTWMEEIERYGGYPTSNKYNDIEWARRQNKIPILNREYNPYIEAFWKWWPELYKEVEHFRITGGEPLLDKNTFKILDYIIDNPNPNLHLSINSNLFVPNEIFLKFLEKIKIIEEKKAIKSFLLYTSCEAYGESAEYIRFGLSYKTWKKNIYKFLKNTATSKISIMATYNALSVTTFKDFLRDILCFKRLSSLINKSDDGTRSIHLDIPYLNNPPHLTIRILTADFLSYVFDQVEYVKKCSLSHFDYRFGFDDFEIHRMERIKTLLIESIEKNFTDTRSELKINRKDFFLFVNEHDKRRGTNFLKTFPEMKNFYELCDFINYE